MFCDANLRQDFYDRDIIAQSLHRGTILKLNDAEAVALSGLLFREELDESTFASRIQEEYSVGLVCVTKGAEGCTVYDGGHRVDCPGTKVQVADTVGAGDAFSAVFLWGYCRSGDPIESAKAANEIGASVASHSGAIPAYPDEIRNQHGLGNR